MQAGPEKRMISMFNEAMELSGRFRKNTYEPAFREFFRRRSTDLEELLSEIRGTEEKSQEELIARAGKSVPDYVDEKLEEIAGKRKRENQVMDYNLALVTFFIPLLLHSREPELEAVADQTIKNWNQLENVTMKIGKSTFEEINGGFRNRLCYVTTAVCRSLDKPDGCYELKTLRDYRDRYLASSPGGRETIREYYNIAPTIVKRIERQKDADEIYRKIWKEYLERCIGLIETGKMEECREVYTKMVHELEREYLFS